MGITISGANGIDMGDKPISNISQIDSTVINENGSNVVSQGELAYDVDTSSYIPNTLTSGAVIERGSNANGEYVKYADGTMICWITKTLNSISFTANGSVFTGNLGSLSFPVTFLNNPSTSVSVSKSDGTGFYWADNPISRPNMFQIRAYAPTNVGTVSIQYEVVSIGRWK